MSGPAVAYGKASWFDRFAKVAPILLFILGGLLGFVVQSVRADSTSETEIRAMKVQLATLQEQQKYYLPADKLVTKEQFAEVVKRLDEKTDRIEKGVNTLLDRQLKGR